MSLSKPLDIFDLDKTYKMDQAIQNVISKLDEGADWDMCCEAL